MDFNVFIVVFYLVVGADVFSVLKVFFWNTTDFPSMAASKNWNNDKNGPSQ